MRSNDWRQILPPEISKHVGKLAALPGYPRHLARFSNALRQMKPKHLAAAQVLAEQARRLAPDDVVVRQQTEWGFRKRVPRWHFNIINSASRNEIYRTALRRHVRSGMVVFEVGTGTGVLAMLAAQAGAGHVYTCEREPLLVEVARENIARNGLTDRITVIPKLSHDVRLGEDMPVRADLFVAELVDDGLLGEEALAITADVQSRLLKPEAVLLPDLIELRGTLVGGPEWSRAFRAHPACGLDVSALDWLGPSVVQSPVCLEPHLAEDVTVLSFDLRAAASYKTTQTTVQITSREVGTADGFLHWIWLRFGVGLEYSNRPPSESCWTPQLHVFPRPLPVTLGQVVNLQVQHDCKRAHVGLEGALF